MNQAIGKRWVEALESGQFRKGSRALHHIVGDVPDRDQDEFCCLGVLCLLAMDDGVELLPDVGIWDSGTGRKRQGYDGDTGSLPERVRAWAGMGSTSGLLPPEVRDDLAQINDRTESFGPVAAAIRKHMQQL